MEFNKDKILPHSRLYPAEPNEFPNEKPDSQVGLVWEQLWTLSTVLKSLMFYCFFSYCGSNFLMC